MARLTGVVSRGSAPADGAYVQLRNLGGDFQAEIRTSEDGRFTFHPVPGSVRSGDGRAFACVSSQRRKSEKAGAPTGHHTRMRASGTW